MNSVKVQYATPCSVTAEQLRQTGIDMMKFDTDYGVGIVRQALAISFVLKDALRTGSVEDLECIYKLTQQLSARFAKDIKVVNAAMRVTYRLGFLTTNNMMGCCRVGELFHMVTRAVKAKDMTLLDTVMQQADTMHKRMSALRLITTAMPKRKSGSLLRVHGTKICRKAREIQLRANRDWRTFPKYARDYLRVVAIDGNLHTKMFWTWVVLVTLLVIGVFVQVGLHHYYRLAQQRECEAKARLLTTFRMLKPLNDGYALWNRVLNRAPGSYSKTLVITCEQANVNAKHMQNAMHLLQARFYTSAGSFLYLASRVVARLLRSA